MYRDRDPEVNQCKYGNGRRNFSPATSNVEVLLSSKGHMKTTADTHLLALPQNDAPDSNLLSPASPPTLASIGELRRIDPHRIRAMSMPNRDAAAFECDEFEDLHQSIVAAGGNSVPISVVQLESPTAAHAYELISGERRLRACIQARLPVLAIVRQADQVPAQQRLLETLQENLARQNLSAYQLGRQLKHAIDAGLSSSARALARDIGRHHSDVSAAIKLASVPIEVVEAFSTTADLQYRFENPLSQALTKNKAAVLSAAQAIKALPERPPAKEVVSLLVAAAAAPAEGGVQKGGVGRSDTPFNGALSCAGQEVGSVQIDRRGHAKITLGIALNDKQQAALHKHIDAFLQRHIASANANPKTNGIDSELTSKARKTGAPGALASTPTIAVQ